jgi:hypothetical protein
MHPRRAGALALGFSLAGMVLVLMLVGLGARAGPPGLTHGTPRDGIFDPYSKPTHHQKASGTGTPRVLPQHAGHSGLPGAAFIGLVVRIALAVWALVLLMRGLLWLQEELLARRNTEPRPVAVAFDVLDDPEPLIQEMRRDADLQMELLLQGEPRNGIVACWERFEEQAERVGLARRSWETSSEFTLRLLDAVSADAGAVSSLAALYREARFSTHHIDDSDRERAIALLQRIRATVGRPEALV